MAAANPAPAKITRRATARNPMNKQIKDTESTESNRDHREMPDCGRRAGRSNMNFSLCSLSFSVASVSVHLIMQDATQMHRML